MTSRPIVLCNAGPLITLGKLNRLELLSGLYGEVVRSEARRLNLRLRGTLGILAQAYHQQMLTLAQTELLIREISVRRDIWIGAKLCEQVLASLKG